MRAACRLEQACDCGSEKRSDSAPAIELNNASGHSVDRVKQVLSFARSVIPSHKIMEGGAHDIEA